MKIFSLAGRNKIVQFSGHERPFSFSEIQCHNPDCSCREVTFSFREAAEDGVPRESPLDFSIYLNVDTGRETQAEDRGETVNRLVEEFLNDLSEEKKAFSVPPANRAGKLHPTTRVRAGVVKSSKNAAAEFAEPLNRL